MLLVIILKFVCNLLSLCKDCVCALRIGFNFCCSTGLRFFHWRLR